MSTRNNVHEVVITGIGLVTPLGTNTQATWENIVAGNSGLSRFDHPDLEGYRYRNVGLVKETDEQRNNILSPKDQKKTDRFIHLALMAGHEAMYDAGLDQQNPIDRNRFGVHVGVGVGGLETVSNAALTFDKRGPKRLSPFIVPKAINNLAPCWLSMQWNLQGPSIAVTSACSSGADAIGTAFRAIRNGYCDYMLAGGTESGIIPLGIAAFGNMRALSSWSGDPKQASRPFDKDRNGFVIAEGSGIIVLERKDLAVKRGAHIYAELAGYGTTADAHHITAMHPECRGAVSAMNQALADAQIDKTKINYINAHGTSTHMNDPLETLALKKVFGEHIIPKDSQNTHGYTHAIQKYISSKQTHALVSSTKSMTGHMLGAAGGVEIALSALALKHQIAPPTINLDNPDPACDLDYVPHKARKAKLEYAMSNSFGFGGGNAVVIVKKA